MLAKQFVDQLEGLGLLDPEIIAELRRQILESKARVTPEALAKLLVDNGHLTKFQATKLIGQLKTGVEEPAPKKQPQAENKNDNLDLAPLDSQKLEKGAGGVPVAKAVTDDLAGEEAVEVVDAAEVVDEVEVVEAVEAVEAVEVVQDAKPPSRKRFRDGDGTQLPLSTPVVVQPASPRPGPSAHAVVRNTKPKKNPWEEFRIMGVGIVLAVMVLAGSFLFWWYVSDSAQQVIERADKAYGERSYEAAERSYQEFAEKFSTDERVSYARVRSALALLHRTVESVADPIEAAKVAKTALPPIAEEPALSNDRADLTGVLLSVAEKFVKKADSQDKTEEKKAMLDGLNGLMEIIDNPQFVGSSERSQLMARFSTLTEDRHRIQRDINRNEQLVKTIESMKSAIAEKRTEDAYRFRNELVKLYPQLEVEPTLTALVAEAAGAQKEKVQVANVDIRVDTDETANAPPKAIVLANHGGVEISEAAGSAAFVQAKGGVYGLDVAKGSVLWRRYVGREVSSPPLRLADSSDSDAIVTRAESGLVERVQGLTGKTIWRAKFPDVVLPPVADGEEVFVATPSGAVCSLDAQSGQVKWAAQIPQNLVVPPGFGKGRKYLYVPGEHSNLYVLSRANGQCVEVLYTGHNAGTIAVPPVFVLGHLFLFENPAFDYSVVRIFKTTEELGLSNAQAPFRLKGNIVIAPNVDGRRVIVITDLSEISVLDIEPSSQKDKVSRLANVVASEQEPRQMFSLVNKNEIWIASNRFARLEIQVSRGQLDRKWIKEDGDQFLGPPQLFGDAIVHSRTVRGTLGTRVAAVKGETGDEIWKTDLGVPIALVHVDATGAIRAVTSQAALFQLEAGSIASGTTAAPVENPGRNDRSLTFANGIPLSGDRYGLLNRRIPNQLALFNPNSSESKVTLISLDLGGSQATAKPIAVGEGVLFPLANGQLLLIDPATGRQLASPFQPPLQPGDVTEWVEPLLLDDKTIIASDNHLKLYRIGVGQQLRLLSESDLEKSLKLRLAKLGSSIVGITAGTGSDSVTVFDSGTLKPAANFALQSPADWGPYVVGNVALVHSASDGLVAIDESGAVKWSIPLPAAAIVDPPVTSGKEIVLSSRDGKMWKIEPEEGKVVGEVAVGEPMSGPPVPVGAGWLVPGDEGVVIAVRFESAANQESKPEASQGGSQ